MMPLSILGAWAGWYRAASSPGYVPFPSARRSRVPFPHPVSLKSGYSSYLRPFQLGVSEVPKRRSLPY